MSALLGGANMHFRLPLLFKVCLCNANRYFLAFLIPLPLPPFLLLCFTLITTTSLTYGSSDIRSTRYPALSQQKQESSYPYHGHTYHLARGLLPSRCSRLPTISRTRARSNRRCLFFLHDTHSKIVFSLSCHQHQYHSSHSRNRINTNNDKTSSHKGPTVQNLSSRSLSNFNSSTDLHTFILYPEAYQVCTVKL